MALIELTGKYAIGAHRHAIVDDDMVAYLSQWRWKAKPNGGGNNVYAVRNAKIDGKNVTLRMHRIVAGLDRDDPLEVDHDNHNSLDNRRLNLVPTTHSKNMLNARRVVVKCACQHCHAPIEREVSAVVRNRAMSCVACKKEGDSVPAKRAVHFMSCVECGSSVVGRSSLRRFCGEACRCRARYRRRGSPTVKNEHTGIARRDISLAIDFSNLGKR
jgi:hypothetical protein